LGVAREARGAPVRKADRWAVEGALPPHSATTAPRPRVRGASPDATRPLMSRMMRAFGPGQVKVVASRAAATRSRRASLELPRPEGKLAAMKSMPKPAR